MHCGDTFLMPAPGGPVTPHLWIVVTQPDPQTHLCAVVSVTTLRNSKDQTIILRPGDHPFIRDCSGVGAKARDLLAGHSEAGAGRCSSIAVHTDESRALLPGPLAAIAIAGGRLASGALGFCAVESPNPARRAPIGAKNGNVLLTTIGLLVRLRADLREIPPALPRTMVN